MSRWKGIAICCVSDGVLKRSLIVALIVVVILNAIDQGDALLGDGEVDWVKMTLTFVVTYFVATYGAVS